MLTEAEHQWLTEREWTLVVMGSYSCGLCQYRDPDDLLCIFRTCPKFTDNWRDAAEFEARLNKLLVEGEEIDLPCSHLPKPFACPYTEKRDTPCSWCNLKELRLLVEKEMEKE